MFFSTTPLLLLFRSPPAHVQLLLLSLSDKKRPLIWQQQHLLRHSCLLSLPPHSSIPTTTHRHSEPSAPAPMTPAMVMKDVAAAAFRGPEKNSLLSYLASPEGKRILGNFGEVAMLEMSETPEVPELSEPAAEVPEVPQLSEPAAEIPATSPETSSPILTCDTATHTLSLGTHPDHPSPQQQLNARHVAAAAGISNTTGSGESPIIRQFRGAGAAATSRATSKGGDVFGEIVDMPGISGPQSRCFIQPVGQPLPR